MSRIIVATLGSVGDLHPFLAIARELVRQGHSVLFLSSEPHRAAVEREGVTFDAILSTHDHERAARHPDLWHPVRGFGVLWRHLAVRSIDPVVDRLTAEVRDSPEPLRVLASPLVLGARLAVDTLSFRLITAHTAASGLRHLDDPLFLGSWRVPAWWPREARRLAWWSLDRWKLQPLALPAINRWRQARELPPVREPVFDRWLNSPHQVIALFPPSFGPGAHDLGVPVRFAGFPLHQSSPSDANDADLQRWLDQITPRPRIAVYAGSSHHHRSKVFERCAAQLDEQGWPVLMILPGQEPTSMGRNSLVRPWVDLRTALPRCHGWLHHGGIGAMAEGLHAGVRQWILPSAYDQFDNAARLAIQSGQPLEDVMVATALVSSGQLPGLNELTSAPVAPELKTSEAGNAAVQRAIQWILEA